MEIIIPDADLQDEMGNCKDLHKILDMYAWEDDILRKYFGSYYKPEEKHKGFSTVNSIMYGWKRIRPKQLVDSLNNPSNKNFFMKREIIWQYLLDNEHEMNLPFKSQDGRDGIPFEKAMPEYANISRGSVNNLLKQDPRGAK